MKALLPSVLVAALLASSACGPELLLPRADPARAGDPRTGDPDPDHRDDDPPLTPAPHQTIVSGVVTQVPSRLGTAAFLIEEHPDRPLGAGAGPLESGEKYHVFVDGQTAVHRRVDPGVIRAATVEEITAGSRVEIWFVGPIRESYPAQGTAGRILIIDWVP